MKISLRGLTGYYKKLLNKELAAAVGDRKKQELYIGSAEEDLRVAKSHVESSKRQVGAYEEKLRAEKKRLEEMNANIVKLAEQGKKKVNLRWRSKRSPKS